MTELLPKVKTSEEILQDYLTQMIRKSNWSSEWVRINKSVLGRLGDLNTVTKEDIGLFLDKLRKSDSEDALHEWIGTYNKYYTILKKFFKWFGAPHALEGFKQLKRKETSTYKPSDLWTVEDDLLFLKHCPSVRDRCYHAIARDSSCRPSEILRLKIKDIVFKQVGNKQYAEIVVNGKTGSRSIPLIDAIPYVKDLLDTHPSRNNTDAYLFRSTKTKGMLGSEAMNLQYVRYREYFKQLLETHIPIEDKNKITELLRKPWNPYIRRHSALTDKSKLLKESVLRNHAGWTASSRMVERYVHYFGNASSEAILEAYGLKPKGEEINKMQPKECPNCREPNKVDSKFCAKCRMVLTYDAYTDTIEERDNIKNELNNIRNDLFEKLHSEVEEFRKEVSLIKSLPKETQKVMVDARMNADPPPWTIVTTEEEAEEYEQFLREPDNEKSTNGIQEFGTPPSVTKRIMEIAAIRGMCDLNISRRDRKTWIIKPSEKNTKLELN